MANNTNLFQQNQPQPAKKQPTPRHDNILEAIRDTGSSIGSGVKRGLVNDFAGKAAQDAFSSLFNPFQAPGSEGRKNPFEGPFPPNRENKRVPRPQPEILRPEKIAAEQVRVKQEIDAVRQELQALAKSINSLNSDLQHAVADIPVDPGVYHLNFFERLKSILRMMRQSVEDSRSWLSVSTSKKKQKGFWGKYKKHGTQFGLSSERTVATQTG